MTVESNGNPEPGLEKKATGHIIGEVDVSTLLGLISAGTVSTFIADEVMHLNEELIAELERVEKQNRILRRYWGRDVTQLDEFTRREIELIVRDD